MIVRLEGFPKLPRLKTLLLNNNRIVRVGRHLEGEIQPLHPVSVALWCASGQPGVALNQTHQHSCMAEHRHRATAQLCADTVAKSSAELSI